ncbi:NAD(P)H-dependent oxidoreductase [soil metagenome]
MKNILIISSSVRKGRKSHNVALYFKNFIEANKYGNSEILDLAAMQLPVFDERLRFQESPTTVMLELQKKVTTADGILIVTPEYNGGYPASLKNVIDLLYDEWYHKPIAIATVSSGPFGGSQVITSLLFTLWKIRALVVTAMFPVIKVAETFDDSGNATDKAATDKRATVFLNELFWMINANEKMKD